MASHNDYKIVAQKSKNYFKLLNVENEIPENQQARMGFYLFILECITNNKDIIEQKNCIIDTEFRSLIFNEKNNDEGVDAVYIDYETNNIKLFNFKYRESFRPNASISTGNALDSSKFLMCIYNENTENLSETTKEYVEEIIRLFSSDDTWNIELYLVSNENIGLQFNDPTIDKFKEFYDLQITSITLDDIKSFISDKPDDLSATFVTDTTSVMTYEENTFSSSKSYLVKMSVANLVRITCQSEVLRNDYNLQDLSEIKDKKIELGILYDNVRGYLGNTKFNENIMKTLDNAPSKFFMYNNGITITAKNITAKNTNGYKKFNCKIDGFQIVNGGQTLRTIYAYKDDTFDEEKLENAEVLVRIFQTEYDENLTNNIAEYTNSQNSISSIDLKSISNLQVQIEQYLEEKNIKYVRKAGDVGNKTREYTYRISMEKLAQMLYSQQGFPDRATNQKGALFDKYYDEIFDAENFDFDNVEYLVQKYSEIESIYGEIEPNKFHQKYLYIIFLDKHAHFSNIKDSIKFLEKTLLEYKKGESNNSPARKLIQKGFKELLKEEIRKNNL